MTSNEETNDNMTSNEETKENTVNSALHQDLDIWLKRELLPINDALKELKNLFEAEIRAKNNEIRLLRADNNRLHMEISTCMEEKNRLADSTSQLKSEIKVLRQKQKSCEETNISNDEILKEIKKIQKSQQNIQKTSKSLHTDYQNTSNNRAEHCNASDSPSCKNRRSVIGHMSLQEIDKPEGINQSINTEVQVPASRHNNETVKENDTSSSMIQTKKSDKTNLQTNIDNQNSIKSYASALTSIEKSEARRESEKTERSDWLSRKYHNKDTKSAFTGYTFVRGKRRTQRIVLANIKARGSSFEDVKTEIIKWCEDRGVNVSGIFLLAHHSARKFPTFVIRANIDVDDYEKTQTQDFWPDTISVRDWIVRTDRNTEPERSEES